MYITKNILLFTLLVTLVSMPVYAERYNRCDIKPRLVELMNWDYYVQINGVDEEGNLLIGLAPGRDNIVDGLIKGVITEVDVINKISFDDQGNETERLLQWNGVIRADDGSDIYFYGSGIIFIKAEIAQAAAAGEITYLDQRQFYSSVGMTFQTSSEKYNFLNNIHALLAETFGDFSDFHVGAQLYAVVQCFDGIKDQLEGVKPLINKQPNRKYKKSH